MALSPQLWCVLISFLVSPGTVVSVDSLIDHLWGDSPPQMARDTIRTYISRINKILGQRTGTRVQHYSGGYQLSVDPQAIDLHRFRSLRRQAESVMKSGDSAHAAALLRQADAQWRGPALMGLPGDWASRVSHRLEDERYETVRLRIKVDLALGRQASLLGELAELVDQHPLDDEIIKSRMVALYRSGRQADAIQVGLEARERFAELGMQLSPEAEEIYERILRNDSGLSVTPAYRRAGQAMQPNTLPPEPENFTGRTEEIETLTRDCRLGNAPLFEVIEGMAGVGKTALAVRVAHKMTNRYPDAQLYLRFSAGDGAGGARDGTDALQRLLRMLDVPAERIPADPRGQAKFWRGEMAHRRAVIVLDDVPDPDQVRMLIPSAGDSLTIATSRRHASWPGRRVLSLVPLNADEAGLLLERAIGSATEHEAAEVAEVVRLCGGLPLAIRVAAGRVRSGDLTGLDGLIEELTGFHSGHGLSNETVRHVFPAFDRSYSQLTEPQKHIFRLLGDCPCADITVQSAMALTGENKTDTEAGVGALLEQYLLERTSAHRFRFHDIIQSYAAARCAQDEQESERRRAISRLMRYYLQVLSSANTAIHYSPRSSEIADEKDPTLSIPFAGANAAHAWLEEEWRNILLTARYAVSHEMHRQCANLTHAVTSFLETNGYWGEALAAHQLALQACHSLDDARLIARAAFDVSFTSLRTGDYEKAERHAFETLAICTSAGDQRGQSRALDQLGLIYRNSARYRDALAYHQEAIDLYQQVGDQRGTAEAVMHAATAFGCLGRYGDEIRNLKQALRLFRGAGDQRGEAITLNNLGAVLDDQGYHRDAIENYEKSLAIFRQIGGRHHLAMLDRNMGKIQHYKGNYDNAIMLYRKALATYYSMGDLQHQAMALCDIGSAFAGMERHSEALVHLEKGATLAQTIGDQGQLASALCEMAYSYHRSGSYTKAAEIYEKAQRLASDIEAPYPKAKALSGMAEILLHTQEAGAAKIYWRKALVIFQQLGVQEAALVELRLHGADTSAS
jgi:DNA-binding SARP family transcriptional activator/tetratricopeptide (TPR) repeat protein